MKICFACSPGGHLQQLAEMKPWWIGHERFWILSDRDDTRAILGDEQLIQPFNPTNRNGRNAVRNFGLALRTFRRNRPDVVVSTGAGVAFPTFLAARLLRIPTVYIEGFGRISEISLSGRLCRRVSDLFLVQWPEQERLVPESKYVGTIYAWVFSAVERAKV